MQVWNSPLTSLIRGKVTAVRDVGNGFLPTVGYQALTLRSFQLQCICIWDWLITEEIVQTFGQKSCYWEQNREQMLGWIEENRAKYWSLLL